MVGVKRAADTPAARYLQKSEAEQQRILARREEALAQSRRKDKEFKEFSSANKSLLALVALSDQGPTTWCCLRRGALDALLAAW